jgi:FAD:protein FMN transferase
VKVLATTLAVITLGCTPATSPGFVERSRQSMGTLLRVGVWSTDQATANDAIEHVFREFDRLEALLSNWKNDSDVTRLNNNAGVAPVKVSQDTVAVLRIAHEVSELTRGKFDITFGVLTDIWRFDHDQDNAVPEHDLIEARLKRIDYTAVDVDATTGTAFINRPGMKVHLGGIGKGYAVDRGIALLRDRGFKDFLIQAGGDLYVAGDDGGKPWTLGIADPRGTHDPFAMVEISDGTLSTSGDYERFFMKDGKRYHHILDPDFGEPSRECRSVTLVSNKAVLADAIAKGVFLLGPLEGMKLIEQLPDIEGVIVTAENEVLISSGLQGRIELLRPPTNAP